MQKKPTEKAGGAKKTLVDLVMKEIKEEPMSDIDYVEMYGMPGLFEVEETLHTPVLLAVAVRFGTTRLIDNVILGVEA